MTKILYRAASDSCSSIPSCQQVQEAGGYLRGQMLPLSYSLYFFSIAPSIFINKDRILLVQVVTSTSIFQAWDFRQACSSRRRFHKNLRGLVVTPNRRNRLIVPDQRVDWGKRCFCQLAEVMTSNSLRALVVTPNRYNGRIVLDQQVDWVRRCFTN